MPLHERYDTRRQQFIEQQTCTAAPNREQSMALPMSSYASAGFVTSKFTLPGLHEWVAEPHRDGAYYCKWCLVLYERQG